MMFSSRVYLSSLLLLLGVHSLVVQNAYRSQQQKRRTVTMVDQNVITGVVTSLAGFSSGIALAYFAENQIVRAEKRGSDVLSESTKAKMSAMFMEDEVMPETGLDETVRRMEEALAKAKGDDEAATEEKKPEPVAAQAPKDDGW